jgi:hypothetical protein
MATTLKSKPHLSLATFEGGYERGRLNWILTVVSPLVLVAGCTERGRRYVKPINLDAFAPRPCSRFYPLVLLFSI